MDARNPSVKDSADAPPVGQTCETRRCEEPTNGFPHYVSAELRRWIRDCGTQVQRQWLHNHDRSRPKGLRERLNPQAHRERLNDEGLGGWWTPQPNAARNGRER